MKKTIVRIVFVCTAMSLCALEWPVTDFKPLHFFGQRAEGTIERGLTIEKAETVRAAGNGILLLTLAQNQNMNGFPGTLGNAVIIAHDDGLFSIYGNLESIDRISERVEIDSLSILSNTGMSGWGNPNSFIFQIIDKEKKTLLNPLLLLPTLKDVHGPSISNVIVTSAHNQTYALGAVKSVKQGKYKLYGDISDIIEGSSNKLSPFRISVLVNGSEKTAIPFETLSESKGKLFLSSPDSTWETMYADPGRTYLGEIDLTRGKSDIAIIARDIAGNERSVLFGLQIE